MTLVIGLYFWAMTIVVLSILRYMVPVMALLFIFSAVAISRGEDGQYHPPCGPRGIRPRLGEGLEATVPV